MIQNSIFTLYASTVLIWGSTWFAIKFQLGVVEPEVSLFYRFMLAAILLITYSVIKGLNLNYSVRDHVFVFLQGAFLFGLNYLIFYICTGYLTSGLVAVIFSSVVIMNIFNGWLLLKKPVDILVVVAAAIGILGIVLVFYEEVIGITVEGNTLRGILLGVVATFFASLGNIISSHNQSRGLPVLQTNAIGMFYGSMLMGCYALFRGLPFTFEMTWAYSLSLVYLSLFGSVFAFGAYLTLIGRIGVDKAAYATVMFPLVALLISTFYENYQWSVTSICGVLLVVAGNIVINGKKQRQWLRGVFRGMAVKAR